LIVKKSILLFPGQDNPFLPGFAGVDGPTESGHAELDNQMKDDNRYRQRNMLKTKHFFPYKNHDVIPKIVHYKKL
jgi:mannosyltransferase OCH1-like enzyme